jgi:hypothetical protein
MMRWSLLLEWCRIVEIDGLLDELQPEGPCVEVEVPGRVAGNPPLRNECRAWSRRKGAHYSMKPFAKRMALG